MVFLLGNFNTQVGRNRDRWCPSLGEFGIGKENSRKKNPFITNAVLGHKIAQKFTSYSCDGKTVSLNDYLIVN